MRLTLPAVITAIALPLAALAAPDVAASSASASAPARQAPCDPFTSPTYAHKVPSPRAVLGFDIGDQEVRVRQSNHYLREVDAATARVRTGVLAKTGQGRPVMYAIVGSPKDVKAAERAARILRNPHTSKKRAAQVAAHAPAIAWDHANVHGNEESGADTALQVLRDLADRTDCAARRIRNNVVTVLVPIQNPDGRWLNYRRNSYGFDMNRDWFARTQPEVDGQLELMRKLPGVLVIDDHEMGTDGFFFPPTADPIYHEIADRSTRWVNNVYSPAMVKKFHAENWRFFNYSTYDMFYIGYGDAVPMEGFLGAGMTFEKNNAQSIGVRVRQQYGAVWSSLSALASHKRRVLTGWAASYRQAFREGKHGRLEPNEVLQPSSTLRQRVPNIKVRSYFIRRSKAKSAEVQSLIRRLQRMDVKVRVLTKPLSVPDYHASGSKGTRATTLPRGTYWITMAQAQKHWIQAMLNEDTYVPFPYFYDVTAWSNPLLMNVAGGRSGKQVHPASRLVSQLPAPPSPGDGPRDPKVGIWLLDSVSSSAFEGEGAMRWLYDYKWRLPFRTIKSPSISRQYLAGLDVLIAPNGYAPYAYHAMGKAGRKALKLWVRNGGRLVTMSGGTEVAAQMGLTSARLRSPRSDVPGSLIRAQVRPGPLAHGVGNTVWDFYEYDNVMKAPNRYVAVRYPSRHSPQWQISGFARKARELGGTAAVVDEPYGRGRVVSFAADPNFRGYTDGTQKILWNAVYGASPQFKGAPAVTPAQRRAAERAASQLRTYASRMVVTVRASVADQVAGMFGKVGRSPKATKLGPDVVQFRIPMASAEESPIAAGLVARLKTLGDDVLAVRLP
jgi:Zinc carboxypeptidase